MPVKRFEVPTPKTLLGGEEEDKETQTAAPAEPPEYFTGYRSQLEMFGKRRYLAGEEVEKAEARMTEVTSRFRLRAPWTVPELDSTMTFPIFPFLTLHVTSEEDIKRLQDEAQANLAVWTKVLGSSSFRQNVLLTLPGFMQSRKYKTDTIEDILNIPAFRSSAPSDADKAWLASTFDSLKYLKNSLPAEFSGSVSEAQSNLVDKLLTNPKLELKAVHNLTVDELIRSVQPISAELPEGLTNEDVRDILKTTELDDEAEKELDAWLAEMSAYVVQDNEKMRLIRTGLLTPGAFDLTPGEFAKLLFTQPMMGMAKVIDKYSNMLPRPLSAMAITGVHRLFNTSDETLAGRMDDRYNQLRDEGVPMWEAYARASSETDMPWYIRLGTEAAFDPTTYVGFGLTAAAATKFGALLTKVGLPRVGVAVATTFQRFHAGFVSGADAIFTAGKEAVLSPLKAGFWAVGAGYGIPRTLTQMSRNFARYGISQFKAVLGARFPKNVGMRGLTSKDLYDTAEDLVKQAITRPGEGYDRAAQAGATLLEYNYLDSSAVNAIVKDAVKEPLALGITDLTHINTEVSKMLAGQSIRITAGNIMSKFPVEITEDTITKVAARLTEAIDNIVEGALKPFKAATPKNMINELFQRLEKVRYENLHSPISTHLEQAGRAVSWVSRVADRVLYSAQLVQLERKLVIPFAKWNLLFMNFGPFNFLENMQRSFLGGADILYPKQFGGVRELEELAGDLVSYPYELRMFEQGYQRLETAAIVPKSGETEIFKGGKIPFVTRRVTIGSKIVTDPTTGAKTSVPRVIGKKVNLYGEDHMIASMQDYYDMWGSLNSRQVEWDYATHYMKRLGETPEFKQIYDAVSAHSGELSGLKGLTKTDVKDIERTVLQKATRHPDLVRSAADVDVLTLERRMIAQKANKILDNATEVHAVTKRGITKEIVDGDIFKDLDASRLAFKDAERELNMYGLQNQIDALKSLADDFAVHPPKTANEFLGDMDNITSVMDGIGERISDYRRLTELRKANLTIPREMDNFEVGSAKLLAEFMDTAEEQVTKMLNTMKDNLSRDVLGTGTLLDDLTHNIKLGDYLPPSSGFAQQVPIIMDGSNVGHLKMTYMGGINSVIVDELVISQKGILTKGLGSDLDLLAHDFANSAGAEKVIIAQKPEHSVMYTRSGYKQTPLGYVKDVMKPKLGESLTTAQKAAADSFNEVSRLESKLIVSTRKKIAEVESAIAKTPTRKRNERFWAQQRSQKADLWDEYFKEARSLKNLRLNSERRYLTASGKDAFIPDNIPPVTTQLTPNHIAYLFGATGDDVYRGLTRAGAHATIRPKEDFILYVKNQADAYAAKLGKTAADLGFTDQAIGDVYDQLWRNIGIDPATLAPDSPTMMQLDEAFNEIDRLHKVMKIDENDFTKYKQYFSGIADDLGKLPQYSDDAAKVAWTNTREQAMTEARELHSLSYPTYEDANIIDETMRTIFPFWNYENFRWRWIPRTWMRTPGTLTNIARYMDYTDGGYIPIPFTDLQINPLRGTIWMGGLRGLWLKDFPEYYDAFPGMEFLDYIGRAGFYPGIHVMAPIVLFGALAGGKPELASLAPAWVQTGLSALRAISPEHIGKYIDIIYPDRFRDYQTMLTLGEWGYDADEIWNKRKLGQKLTPEEEKLWLKAEAKANGLKGILMEQTGLFRIRPQEFDQLRDSLREIIADATGVSVAQQLQIDRMYPVTGKRFQDYYHLNVLQQKLLYSMDTYRRWEGVTTSLLPSSWQLTEVKINEYYEELEAISDKARTTGFYRDGELEVPSIVEINKQLISGEIGPSQWMSTRGSILDRMAAEQSAISNSAAYKDVPKTLEERAQYAADHNEPQPTFTPDQELLNKYFELHPEYKYSWESDRMEYDFDSYYAKIDMLLDSLDESSRQVLLDRIHLGWTPLEVLYWDISREYFRAYRNIRTIVLNTYTDEQKQQIRRFEVARGDERTALQDLPGPGGEKLISGFASKVRDAKQRLRYVDPTLDAWLYFFGTTDTFITKRGEAEYKGLAKQYMTDAMAE